MKQLYCDIVDGNILVKPEDIKTLRQTLKNGPYSIKIIKSRNIQHLRKYWALMNALEYHFGNTANLWHEYFKNKFLPKSEFTIRGEKHLFVSSIAFDKMDQTEFNVYYKSIDTFLLENSYDIDELITTMEGP